MAYEILTLIVKYDESKDKLDDILEKMIRSVMSPNIKIEIGPKVAVIVE